VIQTFGLGLPGTGEGGSEGALQLLGILEWFHRLGQKKRAILQLPQERLIESMMLQGRFC
jgi:hypothetical protein